MQGENDKAKRPQMHEAQRHLRIIQHRKALDLHATCSSILKPDGGDMEKQYWGRREVCELTGVTRRALQGFNEMGLLKPSKIEENGYWYYDAEAIEKLKDILVFQDLGYTRAEILEILENPQDRDAHYEEALERLKEGRLVLDEKIRLLESSLSSSEDKSE